MSIQAIKTEHYLIWNGFDSNLINPKHLCITEDRIIKYSKGNPFPKDSKYSMKDMIYDVTESDGGLTIDCDKLETAEWVADMISELV